MKKRLKNDYSFFAYLFLGTITLGIYSLWCLHKLSKDLNVACEDSGKKTSGIFSLIFFSIITLGLYSVFWWFRVADMLEEQVKKRNLNSEISVKTIILCMILSYIGFGLPSLYVVYQTLDAMNDVATDYNSKLIDKVD